MINEIKHHALIFIIFLCLTRNDVFYFLNKLFEWFNPLTPHNLIPFLVIRSFFSYFSNRIKSNRMKKSQISLSSSKKIDPYNLTEYLSQFSKLSYFSKTVFLLFLWFLWFFFVYMSLFVVIFDFKFILFHENHGQKHSILY